MSNAFQVPAAFTVAAPVAEALAAGGPVVALETAVLTHGLPHPLGLETLRAMAAAVAAEGALPAVIGMLGGQLTVGLAEPLLVQFGLPLDTSYDLLLCALYYRTFIADRGEDEQRLAEAKAAAIQANPFQQPFAPQQPFPVEYKPPPLPQEQMVGIPLDQPQPQRPRF